MPEPMTREDFLPHVHTIFRVDGPVALELELAEIRDLSNAQLEQFSLLFTGPASPWLEQGTYALLHQEKEISLFLVPLGPENGRMVYEAAFTRFASGTETRMGG